MLVIDKLKFFVYIQYLKNLKIYNYLKQILGKYNLPITPKTTTILYDFLLFYYNNPEAQKSLINLYKILKENPDISAVPRYNFLWSLKRNTPLINFINQYSINNNHRILQIYYIIIRQTLDDIHDYKEDLAYNLHTYSTQPRFKYFKPKLIKYIMKDIQLLQHVSIWQKDIVKFYLYALKASHNSSS